MNPESVLPLMCPGEVDLTEGCSNVIAPPCNDFLCSSIPATPGEAERTIIQNITEEGYIMKGFSAK